MKKSIVLLTAIAATASLPASAQFTGTPRFEPAKADLIVEDATIYTPAGPATHMATYIDGERVFVNTPR